MSMNALWEEAAVASDVKINMEVLPVVVPTVLSEPEMAIASEEDSDSNREFPALVDTEADTEVSVDTHHRLTPSATSACQAATQTEDRRGQLKRRVDSCTLTTKKWATLTCLFQLKCTSTAKILKMDL